jgi:hypothetical protein
MADGQVTDTTTDQANQQQQQQQQSLGWRAALPDDLKEHEYVKTFSKPGDFVKSALEVKTERDALKGKLESAIPKLTDKPTPEEIASYRKAMGVPEKPEDYGFPKAEGVEHDPKMVSWAQNLFHSLNLSKAVGERISAEWDQFMKGMVSEEDRLAKEATEKATADFRKQFTNDGDFKAAVELTRRYWEKVIPEVSKSANLPAQDFKKFWEETGAGNDPYMLGFILYHAKKFGEDSSPLGHTLGPTGADAQNPGGLSYPNSPPPPSQGG